MLKKLLVLALAALGAYSFAALSMQLGPTPIETLQRPLFKSAPLVRTGSHASQYAGRTTLNSGSGTVTVSTAAVNSDSLLYFSVQMPMSTAYVPRGQTSLVSGSTSAVASTSAIYSGMNINLGMQSTTSQLSGYSRGLRISSIVDGVSFLIATIDSNQVQGTQVATWEIPEAYPTTIKVNTIVSNRYVTFGWADERPRPLNATIMWELRRST